MDKLSLGIVIGGALAGSFTSTMMGAQRSVVKIGEAATAVQAKLNALRAGPGIVFAKDVERLERSIARLRHHQAGLGQALEAQKANEAHRAGLRGQIVDVVALGAAFAGPMKAAIDFESAMADVRKVVDFPTLDGLRVFGNDIKAMSREIPISAAGLAAIAASGGQLGVALKQLPDFTRLTAKMATAFEMTPEVAGEAMAKLANVYQLPITQMGVLGDAINHLSDTTAAKASGVVEVLGRIGGNAKQFGLTAVQAAALGTAVLSLGKSPEVAGTGINALLGKLQTADKQGKKFQSGLSAIGLTAGQVRAALAKDAQGGLMMVLERIEKLDPSKRAGVLADMFGLEYADDIALLTGSLGEYRKALDATADDKAYAGSMDREFANRAKTTANQLQLLKNNAVELGINLGSALLPALNDILGVLSPVITKFADWAAKNPELIKYIGMAVGGMLAMKVAVLGAGYAFTFIKGTVLSAKGAFHSFAAAYTMVRELGLKGLFSKDGLAKLPSVLKDGALGGDGSMLGVQKVFVVNMPGSGFQPGGDVGTVDGPDKKGNKPAKPAGKPGSSAGKGGRLGRVVNAVKVGGGKLLNAGRTVVTKGVQAGKAALPVAGRVLANPLTMGVGAMAYSASAGDPNEDRMFADHRARMAADKNRPAPPPQQGAAGARPQTTPRPTGATVAAPPVVVKPAPPVTGARSGMPTAKAPPRPTVTQAPAQRGAASAHPARPTAPAQSLAPSFTININGAGLTVDQVKNVLVREMDAWWRRQQAASQARSRAGLHDGATVGAR
jgi:TP901 family phage tail tape measure protein